MLKANVEQADTNDDTTLTSDEFPTFVDLNAEDSVGRFGMVKRFGRYDRAFKRLDADGNGLVTAEEIHAAAEQMQRQNEARPSQIAIHEPRAVQSGAVRVERVMG